MKKLPSQIRIKRNVTYEIVWSDIIGENPETLAECRYESKQIVIKVGQSESQNWKCLIHELFHALEFEYRIPIPHKIIYLLEEAIFKLIKLNKFLD